MNDSKLHLEDIRWMIHLKITLWNIMHDFQWMRDGCLKQKIDTALKSHFVNIIRDIQWMNDVLMLN